ncbi:TetR/AcrR family transcriptional repressor of nem operon [Variovorax boronicumulans]|uniref:TetR/AcrR family transcriptional regulator n=1 Tax=Variovorax boronicumulans TaxID=436515 RepID=UPI002476EB2E|nr:TetR/AcrR family transcriptional regulator [Variovorax boronicumulans]MDH6170770.1 TetR/AcrR family transcriptional repressor of nem operon [Variovorax boronicumulans]
MARPREFDRDAALERAMKLFWAKGFASTSTDDLIKEMGIGRQSLYNAFGDKRQLYLEVLHSYQQISLGAHLERLNEPASPLAGILKLLGGLAVKDDKVRALGCFGVSSIGEFGASDPELKCLSEAGGAVMRSRIAARIREGQEMDEIDPSFAADEAAAFVLMVMMGLQVKARAGASVEDMQQLATFTVKGLKA